MKNNTKVNLPHLKWFNILSLFDWMSCGRVALERAWIKVDTYYASEIDKYAIQISNKNYPDIIQVWNITKLNWSDYNVDLVIWWSPCQSFSIAWNQKWFEWKSWLFYEYIRILKEIKPKYFLLENVKMKKEFQDIITKELISIYPDMQLYEINSSLVSAQNRKRLYRTNIQWIEQPQDKWILLKDILENNVEDKYYMTINQFKNLWFESLQRIYFDKAPTLSTMQWWHRQPKVVVNKYNQRIMLEKCWTLWT